MVVVSNILLIVIAGMFIAGVLIVVLVIATGGGGGVPCALCGTSVRPGARFCGRCGKRLERSEQVHDGKGE